MKAGVVYPQNELGGDTGAVRAFAQAAEDLGYDHIVIYDHGVGPATAAKMQRLGIRTGADLRAKSLAFLQQHFGKSAAWYLGIANGEDDRPVVADRPRKSSGSETTFERDLTAPEEIEAGVEAMIISESQSRPYFARRSFTAL